MKKLKVIFCIFSLAIFQNSCTNIDLNNNQTNSSIASTTDSRLGKWVVSDVKSAYNSFEYLNSKSYLVIDTTSSTVQFEGSRIHFGTLKMTKDSLLLNEFGTVKLITIEKDSTNFTFESINKPGKQIKINAKAAPIIPTSLHTEMLCRSWEVDSINKSLIKNLGKTENVIFSQSGTYFSQTTLLSGDKQNIVGQWDWKTSSDSTLCFALKGEPQCEAKNVINILVLTPSLLTYRLNSRSLVTRF